MSSRHRPIIFFFDLSMAGRMEPQRSRVSILFSPAMLRSFSYSCVRCLALLYFSSYFHNGKNMRVAENHRDAHIFFIWRHRRHTKQFLILSAFCRRASKLSHPMASSSQNLCIIKCAVPPYSLTYFCSIHSSLNSHKFSSPLVETHKARKPLRLMSFSYINGHRKHTKQL